MPAKHPVKKTPRKTTKPADVLYVNGVPLAVRQRITAGAKVRGLSVAAYIVQLVALHDRMLNIAADSGMDDPALSILKDTGLGPVSK